MFFNYNWKFLDIKNLVPQFHIDLVILINLQMVGDHKTKVIGIKHQENNLVTWIYKNINQTNKENLQKVVILMILKLIADIKLCEIIEVVFLFKNEPTHCDIIRVIRFDHISKQLHLYLHNYKLKEILILWDICYKIWSCDVLFFYTIMTKH